LISGNVRGGGFGSLLSTALNDGLNVHSVRRDNNFSSKCRAAASADVRSPKIREDPSLADCIAGENRQGVPMALSILSCSRFPRGRGHRIVVAGGMTLAPHLG
jgi:hypothetical protein